MAHEDKIYTILLPTKIINPYYCINSKTKRLLYFAHFPRKKIPKAFLILFQEKPAKTKERESHHLKIIQDVQN